jgi:hypothetical protein
VCTGLAVDELWRLALEQPLEVLGVEPTRHHRHREELGAERAKHLHRARIRRLLDGHEVAGVEERPRDEIEALLRAVDDQDLLGAPPAEARR